MDKQLPSPEDRITVKSATADKAMRLSEAKPRPEQEAMRSVGRKLAQLREARRWKMEDLSEHLKVPVIRLRALEAGNLDSLPEMAFVIGMVRSYAKMLDVDPAPLVGELRQAHDLPGTPLELPGSDGVKLPRRHRSWTARYGLWGGAGACVLLLVAWLFRQYTEREIYARPPASRTVTESPQKEINAPDTHSPDTSAPAHFPVESAASAVDRLDSPHTAEAPPAENHVQSDIPSVLHFKVSQNTWISVRQREDGQSVYTGLLSAGEERDIQAQPPVDVVVGNVAGLESLELDGEPVEPSKYKGRQGSHVARFSLP